MRLGFSHERILAVVAHPDDAELLCAGTLARAESDGAAVAVCVMCRGDKGQGDVAIENLADARSTEMAAAMKLLGAELMEAGFGDGELFDTVESRRSLIEFYRRFRPTLVLAHSIDDYHPDHRAASAIAEAATWFCASKGHVTESPALEVPPALWWMDTVNMTRFVPDLYIDVTDFIDLKRRMIRCHRSQLNRAANSDFAPLEAIMLRQAEARGAQSGVEAAEAFRLHAAWKRMRAW